MRVVLITAANTWSGVEVHTLQLARALRDRGHEVSIVELGRRVYESVETAQACPVHYVDLGGRENGSDFGSIGLLGWRRLFSAFDADLAVLVKGVFHFGPLVMEAAARSCFPRLMAIEHLHEPLAEPRPEVQFSAGIPRFGFWWYRKRLVGYLRSLFPNRVICVSAAVADTLHRDFCYPVSKLVVARSGVDTHVFFPNRAAREATRAAWRIPESAFVFGTLGRISPMKNHKQLVQAFAVLCAAAPERDLRLAIVGEGPLRNCLERYVEATNFAHRVTFAGFSTAPESVIPAFDAFCLPSISEALGIALLEAMACGCPAIASSVGGVPEILDDQCGWLVQPGCSLSLERAMRQVIEMDVNALAEVSARARQHVVQNFEARERWNDFARFLEG
jgi:glycosyltransferase involved in cell wall biosynthesis